MWGPSFPAPHVKTVLMAGFAAAFRPSLNKHGMERLARITRQNIKKHHTHHETVKHLQEIRRRQQVATYEIEYNNLRAASIQSGPLHVAAIRRLAELKRYI